MDCSLPGFSVHGIFQARVLEWVAISFSRRSSWPRDWTQVSRIFSLVGGQEYWSGLPFPSPGDLPDSGTEPRSPICRILQGLQVWKEATEIIPTLYMHSLPSYQYHSSERYIFIKNEPALISLNHPIAIAYLRSHLGVMHSVSSVQSLSLVWLFAPPRAAACQASLSITKSWSLLKLVSIELMLLSHHLTLCRPLLLLPSIFPSIRAFPTSQWACTKV